MVERIKNPPDCCFPSFLLSWFTFVVWIDFFLPCIFERVLWCSCPKIRSTERFSSSLFTYRLYCTLIGGSNFRAPFQNPYPKKIMILISYITALSILHFCSAVHSDSRCLVLTKKRHCSFDCNRSLIQLAATSQLHYLPSPWLHQSLHHYETPSVIKIASVAADNMGHVVHLRKWLLPHLLYAFYNRFNKQAFRGQKENGIMFFNQTLPVLFLSLVLYKQ